MAEILTRRHRVTVPSFAHSFDLLTDRTRGLLIDCTQDGTILGDSYATAEERHQQFSEALNGDKYTYEGIKDFSHDYTESATLRCACGKIVVLNDPMDNECECGQIYNGNGDALRPREEWEEPWDED